ncbi:hypothetical protein AAG570_005918 [Ranatra chinensis]|uniref:limulus clotting factor C n=1 Tax=Ranatra chinensis TaxID=642074 RepID=A0ABD0XWU4_9HEMI
MVALVISTSNALFCGGSLISDVHVLTAAHCLYGLRPYEVDVVFSESNHVDTDEGMSDRRAVIRIATHRNYNRPRKWNNDIAILTLDFPAPVGTSAVPVCLPKPGLSFEGDHGYIAGWGRTSEDGSSSMDLQIARVPILGREQCSKLAGYANITDDMMCAGHLHGGVDACQGDSGGPLLIADESGRTVIAGIVSWGIGCARPYKPGVYTRVNNFISWIANNTKNGCYCS